MGFINNVGRILGGQAPVIIGALSASVGLGNAMAYVGIAGFGVTVVVALFMQETRAVELR